ncbi:MAG TPA: hypothetical protein VMY78_16035 [Solirubrobacteraceae bacterium]|nr:hypothetical protein [Solirubrobacteraceae bacterium]
MRPPLEGRRAAARRLAADVRRRLGLTDPDPEPAGPFEPPPPPVTGEQAAHRIDAARARLRATITPPEDEQGS